MNPIDNGLLICNLFAKLKGNNKMENNVEEMIEVAAAWWANKIMHASFDSDPDSPAMAIAEFFATDNAMMKAPDSQKSDKFKNNLITIIKKTPDLEKYKYLAIRTDYHPDQLLKEAAHISGVDEDVFPWKTTMEINVRNMEVTVTNAMTGKSKIVYPKPQNG